MLTLFYLFLSFQEECWKPQNSSSLEWCPGLGYNRVFSFSCLCKGKNNRKGKEVFRLSNNAYHFTNNLHCNVNAAKYWVRISGVKSNLMLKDIAE